MEKVLGYIGLAKRAGKLVQGTDAVLKNLRSRKTFVMVVAKDASFATQETVKKKGKFYNIPVIDKISTADLSKSLGCENIKVIGINDQGFAKAIIEGVERMTIDESQRIS